MSLEWKMAVSFIMVWHPAFWIQSSWYVKLQGSRLSPATELMLKPKRALAAPLALKIYAFLMKKTTRTQVQARS